jgi:hypothetical protein
MSYVSHHHQGRKLREPLLNPLNFSSSLLGRRAQTLTCKDFPVCPSLHSSNIFSVNLVLHWEIEVLLIHFIYSFPLLLLLIGFYDFKVWEELRVERKNNFLFYFHNLFCFFNRWASLPCLCRPEEHGEVCGDGRSLSLRDAQIVKMSTFVLLCTNKVKWD